MKQLFRLIWGIFAITALFFLIAVFAPGSSRSQGARGIDSYGRDFYLGYMPAGGEAGNPINGTGSNAYILICSLANDNTVTVSYFGSDGSEIGGTTHIVQQGRCLQMQIPSGMMTPDLPGETPQFKAAHIVSKYPVTVQFYMEGSNSGGLYLGIPTSALGTHYITACYFDNPLQDNPSPAPFRDSDELRVYDCRRLR
jgi:hypothetical protein